MAELRPSSTRYFPLAGTGEVYPLAAGPLPGPVTLAYETYGTLNAAGDNAILLFHALSGSQHAGGHNPKVERAGDLWTEEVYPGWWDEYIGPGRALDTDRFFVVCANYIGGCYGSTGPRDEHPVRGLPWGSEFPSVTVADQCRAQARLLDHLGVGRCHAVIGASVGGLLALTFATLFPERAKTVVPIASGFKTTVLNRLMLFEQILAIENDPHFNGGDYYPGHGPVLGLALARMISHKTFVHLDAIERRARAEVLKTGDHLSWFRLTDNVQSYMMHQGKKFVHRFDANTYLRICEMWSLYDPVKEAGAADERALFAPCRDAGQRFLVFTIDSDFCFYPEEQADLVKLLKTAGVDTTYITVHTDKGHDSFLLEPHLFAPHLDHLLNPRG
jgi:homoserine O-acetyltransferase/O-succinyltransferase